MNTLQFDPKSGAVLGACTYLPPLAELPADEIECTADQAAAWMLCSVKDGAIVQAVAPAPLRTAATYALMSALTDAQRTAYANAKQWDQRLFSARDTPWPETNEKIGRIAIVIGTTPKAWFDAALGMGV